MTRETGLNMAGFLELDMKGQDSLKSSVHGRNSVSMALLVDDCALRNYFFLLEVLHLISSGDRPNVIQTSSELKQTWQ